jgi:GNAT superfamily N-acetyltransferase
MQPTVRSALPTDLDAMVDLLGLLFAQEADFTPNPELQRAALSRILASPELGCLLVALVQGEAIGMASLLYTISTAEGGAAAWLEDMVVHPDFRNMGVGSRLLKEATRTCREKGIRRITLLTDKSNDSAKRFYAHHGFSESAMVPFRLYC